MVILMPLLTVIMHSIDNRNREHRNNYFEYCCASTVQFIHEIGFPP